MKSVFALFACALIAGGGVAFAQQEDPHALVKSVITIAADDAAEKLLGEVYSGELAEGEGAIFSVRIDPAKSYMLYGACDITCGDLDTVILDKSGNIIDSDDGSDDTPIISVEPGGSGDQLNLRVEMQSCEKDKCIWALGIYEQL